MVISFLIKKEIDYKPRGIYAHYLLNNERVIIQGELVSNDTNTHFYGKIIGGPHNNVRTVFTKSHLDDIKYHQDMNLLL